MNITVLGAGAFGTALANILTENHHTPTFFDPIKLPDITLDQALQGAEAIVISTPSHSIPVLAPHLRTLPIPIILATKGLLTLDYFAPHPVSLISGAAFADDLLAKKPGTLTATDPSLLPLFETSWLDLQITPDTLGVMFCGSLKGIYALGSGLLAAPQNYVEKSLAELKLYLEKHGAFASTADLSCGVDDLRLVCTDPRSRNFQFGAQFRREPYRPPSTTVEGLTTLAELDDYKRYPIIRAIHDVFAGDSAALQRLAELTQ